MTNRRRRYLIAVPGLALLLVSSMVTCQPAPSSTPAPSGRILIEDSFTIAPRPGSLQALNDCWLKYHDITASDEEFHEVLKRLQLPFTDCGLYLSDYFYLVPGQAAKISIMSEIPVGVPGACVITSGLHMLPLCKGGSWGEEGDFCENCIESCTSQRYGDGWETNMLFRPEEPVTYQLWFFNESGKSCWCEYSVSLAQ